MKKSFLGIMLMSLLVEMSVSTFNIKLVRACTFVKYEIFAYDKAGNCIVKDNDGQYYVYSVIPEFSSHLFTLISIISISLAFLLAKKLSSCPILGRK